MKVKTILIGAAVLGGAWLGWRKWQGLPLLPHSGAWALAPGHTYGATLRMSYNSGQPGAAALALAELAAMGAAQGFTVAAGPGPASASDPTLWSATLQPSTLSATGGAIQSTATTTVINVTAT